MLGKFKDEENGMIIKEVICLKPKMYCVLTDKGLHKKAKGIPKNKVENELTFDKFKSTLHNNIDERIKYASSRSRKHVLHTIDQEKTGLTNYDDKRFWLSDQESLPFGHHSIM